MALANNPTILDTRAKREYVLQKLFPYRRGFIREVQVWTGLPKDRGKKCYLVGDIWKILQVKKKSPERHTFKRTFLAVRYQLSVFKFSRTHKADTLKTHNLMDW